MRQEEDFFADAQLDLIYMARRLREALKLEGLLTDAGIDYLVETGTYTGGLIFKRDLTGAFFYVLPQDTERAHAVLRQNRLKPYVESG
jgi:hypothetical protein